MKGGIRLRLALRASLLSGVALAGFGVVVEFAVVGPMVRREDDRLVSLAEGLAALVSREGPAGFRTNADSWVRASRDEWAVLCRQDGSPFAVAGRAIPEEALRIPGEEPVVVDGLLPDGDRAVSRPAGAPDGAALRVVAGFSLREARGDQRALRLLVAISAAAGVVLVGVGAWTGAGAVLDPLGAMTEAARSASADPSGLRLPVEGRGGEFEELGLLLNDLLGRIDASLEEERRFASEAAHELRGPLAVLRLRVEEALAEGTPGEMRRALEGALEDCDRVGRLVEALLELSRTAAGGGTGPAAVPVDAAAVLASLAPDLEALARSRGLRLEAPPPGASPLPVAAPREVIETCVSILVDNACRYAPRGGTVRLSAAGEDGRTRVVVADEGPGVGEDEKDRVFDRLYRGKAARAAGARGFGLGLPLARRLARSAGGDVVLENPGGGGARFAVLLPRA